MREVPSTRSWDQSKGGMGAGVRFAVLSYESTVQRCLDHQQKTMRVSEEITFRFLFFSVVASPSREAIAAVALRLTVRLSATG